MKKYIADNLDERLLLAEETLPKIYTGSFAVAGILLKTALFSSVAKGERKVFTDYTEIAAPAGFVVKYKGEELRQDDLRVLLTLIKLNAGRPAGNAITFHARTFCREVLQWADSSDSVEKLKASIARMHDARIRVTGKKQFWFCSLVSSAHIDEDGLWTVNLDKSIAEMMKAQLTFLSVVDRLTMRDGLESWMYGYVKADACLAPIEREELRELSGCTYAPKDFNKHLKAVMDSFKSAGMIKDWFLDGQRRLIIKK